MFKMKYKVSSYLNISKHFYYKMGVYKIYHIINPTIVYIGSTKTIGKYTGFYKRLTVHIRDLITNRHHSKYLQNVVNKYGIEGIRFEIIDCMEDTQEAIRTREKFWINYYLATNSKYGYNTIFDVTLIESRKSTGSKRVLQYDLNGNFIKEWNSIEEAARFYDNKGSNISKASKTTNKQVAGFQWRYWEKGYSIKITPYQMGHTAKVYMYDLEGNFLQEFVNGNKASIQLGISSNQINACLNGRQKVCKGNQFSYEKVDKLPPLLYNSQYRGKWNKKLKI